MALAGVRFVGVAPLFAHDSGKPTAASNAKTPENRAVAFPQWGRPEGVLSWVIRAHARAEEVCVLGLFKVLSLSRKPREPVVPNYD